MRLRVTVEGTGEQRVISLPSTPLPTWADLCTATGLSRVERCRTGTQDIPVLEDNVPLEACGVRSGDALVLTARTASAPPGRQNVPLPKATPAPGVSVVTIEDDNHCLFRALSYALCGGDRSDAGVREMRTLAGRLVLADPAQWTEVVLAMPPATYAHKIATTTAWGGAIELALFAEHFGTAIVSVDVASGGRTDVFGDAPGRNAAFVLYTGIHYDVLADRRTGQAVFGPEERAEIARQAVAVAEQMRKVHAYTDTARFALRCTDCGEALVGAPDAEAHAKRTGHVSFSEYA